MNLKVKLPPFLKGFLVSAVIVTFLCFAGFVLIFPDLYEEKKSNENSYHTDEFRQEFPKVASREHTFEETSPDKGKKIVRYRLGYQPELFSENQTTYYNNNIIISVIYHFDDVDREYFLFTGEDRTGYPHWLGNMYVFFTAYCGTSCQSLILLDTKTKQVRKSVLSYTSRENEKQNTHFDDWFNQEFKFNGFVNKIHAEVIDNQPYLIFDMVNDIGVESGQKKFLFTGDALILES